MDALDLQDAPEHQEPLEVKECREPEELMDSQEDQDPLEP